MARPPRSTLILETSQSEIAGRILRQGGLVVFPTETVYGLGADACNADACAAIFIAKGRPADNPLIVHIVEQGQLELVAAEVDPISRLLFDRFAPGPLTLVLPRGPRIAEGVTAGLESVAVRFPSHPVARAVITAARTPIAAPSANRSGRPSPTDFDAACDHMKGRVDAIVRGGSCDVGLESTVARVVGRRVELLREGVVTAEMIAAVLPQGSEVVPLARDSHAVGPSPSPGVHHRHYQPDARVVLATPDEVWNVASRCAEKGSGRIGLLTLEAAPPEPAGMSGAMVDWVSFGSLDEYARELYRAFRRFDSTGCSVIVAELPRASGIGRAIRDRLHRAAGDA